MIKVISAVLVCLFACTDLAAGELPSQACGTESAGFANGFDAVPRAGSQDLLVTVPGRGVRSFPVRVPASITPPRRVALVITLHGAGGPGSAPAAAALMRDSWSATADSGGFIVLAPAASGSQGGWLAAVDYPALSAAISELQRLYPIDPRRLYLHGFSAGGHVAHDLALYNAHYFAAYVVNAGVLQAFAGATAPQAALRSLPVQVRMGSDDSLLAHARADRERFLAAGWREPDDYQLVEFAGGHDFDAGHAGPAWRFLCRRALPD